MGAVDASTRSDFLFEVERVDAAINRIQQSRREIGDATADLMSEWPCLRARLLDLLESEGVEDDGS